MDRLSLNALRKAVGGEFAAIRRVTRLEPQGEKVFPPTYEGGEYAEETRRIKNGDDVQAVETVLLDSVQSQANRMEIALLRAYDRGEIEMPLLLTDFVKGGTEPILSEIGRVTALEAPHRMCDAIFRDSLCNGQPFRDVDPGAKLNGARTTNATPVLELCPTALLFGFWDSAGPRGGLGAKVQRALVSEIVGYSTQKGKRPTSRIDPLQIEKIETDEQIYAREGGGWTFDSDAAQKNDKGEPITKDPSHINHGNIVPSLWHDEKKDGRKTGRRVLNHGGM